MKLTELSALLKSAASPSDVFGADIEKGFRDLAKICHPDRFKAGSADAALAETVFKALCELRDRSAVPDQILKSPTGEYSLKRILGNGDLSAAWLATHSKDSGQFVVKVPRIAKCNNLVAKEAEILRQFREQATGNLAHYGKYFPILAESFEMTSPRARINAFRRADGYVPLSEVRSKFGDAIDPRHLAWIFRRLLEALDYVHSRGWINAAVLPDHILVNPATHGLQLLGWIHSVKRDTVVSAVSMRYKDWYPSEVKNKQPAMFGLDHYLAARTLAWLAGWTGTGHLPPGIPKRFAAFLRGCMLDSPSMRPQRAWDLHEELAAVLKKEFGPPRFVPMEL